MEEITVTLELSGQADIDNLDKIIPQLLNKTITSVAIADEAKMDGGRKFLLLSVEG